MTDIEYLKKYYEGNIDDAIKRLNNGEPVQYIVGNVDFYGYPIVVNKSVLIPRFETELLVSKTVDYINKLFNKKVDIIDIGTGSGCIDVALYKAIDCNITSVDISEEALKTAEINFTNNNCNINVIKGDILNNIKDKFDCIISNPPYIRYDEEIMDIVKNNEPSLALYADNNGLYFYEEILKNCHKNLNKQYLIAFEIGYLQGKDIIRLSKQYLDNPNVIIEKDYSGKERYAFIYN